MKKLSNNKLLILINTLTENHEKTKIQITSILDKLVENEKNVVDNTMLAKQNEKLLNELILLDELKIELEEKYLNLMQELKNRAIF